MLRERFKNDGVSIVAIARLTHEVNRAYCALLGEPQPPWDDAPEWQKASAIAGVQGAIDGATPEQSHQEWTAKKHEDGWVYGPVKDPEAKTHPCLVPYGA